MADELMQAGILESMSWWNTTPAKSFLPATYCSVAVDGLGPTWPVSDPQMVDSSSFQPLSFDASAWINPQDIIVHGGEDYGMFDLNTIIQGGEWSSNSGSSSPLVNSSGMEGSTLTSMFPTGLLDGDHEILNSQWNTNQVLGPSSSFAHTNNIDQNEELVIDQIRATLLGASPAPSLPSSPLPRSRKTTNSKAKKKEAGERCDPDKPSMKRQRIETPSSLPTFKVRKEKLGDRITALQQLVSPFGKTDTASVLHEAIEYIKFLHDQVDALRTPYMKNGAPIQHHQQQKGKEEDLKSKGLCLVPIASTFPVAHETTADFWTPTFGATFR